jgi:hypothetical protein
MAKIHGYQKLRDALNALGAGRQRMPVHFAWSVMHLSDWY